MSTVPAKPLLPLCLAALFLLSGRQSALADPALAGEASIRGGETISLAVPAGTDAWLLRFSEQGIDVRLRWQQDAVWQQANAAGRRHGEQLLYLAAGQSRPQHLQLLAVMDDAPAGRVRWQWEPVSANAPAWLFEAQRLESEAARLADAGTEQASATALEHYLQALRLHRQAASPRWPELAFRAGQLHSRLNQWAEGLATYAPALEATQDAALRLRLHNAMGYLYHRLGEQRQASMHFSLALQLALAQDDPVEQALVQNNLCLPLHQQGDMAAAADCLRKADTLYAQAGLVEARSRVLTNLAAALTALGRWQEAVVELRRATTLVDGWQGGTGALYARAAARLHLAWALLDGGEYGEALQVALAGQEEATQTGSDWLQGQLIRVSAVIMVGLGQPERARAQLDLLLSTPALAATISDPARVALAAAQLEPDPQQRRQQLQQVRRMAATADDDRTYLRAWLAEAQLVAAEGEAAPAQRAAQGVLAMARRLALVAEETDALALLGEVAPPAQARLPLQQAWALAREADLPLQMHRILHAQSRAAQAQGDWLAAREAVVQAEQLQQRMLLGLGPDSGYSLARRLQGQAAGSMLAAALAEDLDTAQRASWLWRRAGAIIAGGAPSLDGRPAAVEDYHAIRTLLAAESALPDALQQAESWRHRLESREASARMPWPALRAVSDGLPAATLLLLLADEPQSVALLVEADRQQLLLLPSGNDLQTAVDSLLRGLGRQDPLGAGALQARIAHLQGLLAPLLQQLQGSSSVAFLGSPGLEALPLEVLLDASPQPPQLKRLWPAARQSAAAPPGSGGIMMLQAQAEAAEDWVPLPAAAAEVAQLQALLAGQSIRHLQGSAAADYLLRSDRAATGSRPRLLHVASHAVPARQWSSLQVLAFGPQARAQVPLGSLRSLPAPADLVVLAACASGRDAGGQSSLGFAQAFVEGGAGQVLASAWPIDDAAASAFVARFYEAHLEQGLTPAQALLQAQRWMRTQPRWQAPYWWAGFQLWLPLQDSSRADGFLMAATTQPR